LPDAIAQIPEADWQPLADYPAGGEAQIPQTSVARWRLVVRRSTQQGLVGQTGEVGIELLAEDPRE
jgi:hypothetical protein